MPIAKLDETLDMYYEDDDFTDPWRPSEAVVMHHGNSKNSQLWYAWVPLLSRQYRVIRIDARGFGRSTVPPEGYNWSLTNFATDLLNLLDYLGLEKVHLVGETIGGTISLQFAYEHPERLHSLTVCTSPIKFVGVQAYLDNYKLVKEEGVSSWVRKTTHQRLDPNGSDPGHSNWYAQQMSQTAQRVVEETMAYLSTQDISNILPSISTPTLVLVAASGSPDDTHSPAGMARLMPNAKLVEIPGTSGFVQHSAPDKCAEAWREFVSELKPR